MKNCKNCGNGNCKNSGNCINKFVDINNCIKMNYSQWRSKVVFIGMSDYSDDELAELSDQFDKILEYARNKDNGQ